MNKMNEDFMKFIALPLDQREAVIMQIYPNAGKLKEKLLAIGGQMVIWMPNEIYMSALSDQGIEYTTNKIKKVRGEVNHCHANTAKLFLRKSVQIITGFALNEDRWIRHSWAYDGEKILETTFKFNAYYGIKLEGLEITKFILGELKEEIMNLKLPKKQLAKIPIPKNAEELLK